MSEYGVFLVKKDRKIRYYQYISKVMWNYTKMYLLPGHESEEKFNILVSFTSLKSENMINALKRHLVKGAEKEFVIAIYNVQQQNFSRDLNKLKGVAEKLERYKEIEWPKYQELKEFKEQHAN